jgi:hypothetical protein
VTLVTSRQSNKESNNFLKMEIMNSNTNGNAADEDDDSDRRFTIDNDEEVNNRELEMDELSKEADNIERDDDEGQQGTLHGDSLAKQTAMKRIRNAEVPSILHIYGIDRACCGTEQNTEYRFLPLPNIGWFLCSNMRKMVFRSTKILAWGSTIPVHLQHQEA